MLQLLPASTGGFHKTITEEEIAYALRTIDSSESVTQRLLEAGTMRGANFGGTVIVGRALTEAAAPGESRGAAGLRAVTVALAVLVILSFLATTLLHAFLGP